MAQSVDVAGVRLPGQGFPINEDEDARLLKRLAAFGAACVLRPASVDAANRLRLQIHIVDGVPTVLRSKR